jgi:RNA polymerase sigma-70 factor (ECF subfamily)
MTPPADHPIDATAHPASDHWQPFVAGLRAFVARRVPARDAEDVAQEVLLRLHQSAAGLRDASRAEAWVYAIARRTIADHFRARRPTDELGDEAEALAADGEAAAAQRRGFASFPGDHSVHEEVLSWLRPMAEELPEGYRRALLLADFEGLTQRQVADRLGLSLSGAKSRVQRARRMLGEELRRCCEVEIGADGTVVDFRRRRCEC